MGLRNNVHRFAGNAANPAELAKDHIHSLVRLNPMEDGYRYRCETCSARLKRKSGVVIEDLKKARLLAAAPALLESLREIVTLTDRKTDIWDKAHAAIDKAEGR